MRASHFKVILSAVLLAACLSVPAGAETKNAARIDNSCDITGTVTSVNRVSRSPWDDGTPSTLSVYETHIQVSVHARRPHRTDAPADSPCNAALEKAEMRKYKLCSAARPKKGDRIMGTEGGSTGSSRFTQCLFDIRVMKDPAKPVR